ARPRAAARIDRSRQAERPRRLAGRRASVRSHRRKDRGGAGEAARGERLRPRAGLDLRGRRARRDGDFGGSVMADRYQQLVNTPIGKIVSKQIGLPTPIPLERYEPGQPVVTGPVLLGAAPGSGLTAPICKVLAAIGAEVETPSGDEVR